MMVLFLSNLIAYVTKKKHEEKIDYIVLRYFCVSHANPRKNPRNDSTLHNTKGHEIKEKFVFESIRVYWRPIDLKHGEKRITRWNVSSMIIFYECSNVSVTGRLFALYYCTYY